MTSPAGGLPTHGRCHQTSTAALEKQISLRKRVERQSTEVESPRVQQGPRKRLLDSPEPYE